MPLLPYKGSLIQHDDTLTQVDQQVHGNNKQHNKFLCFYH